MKQIDCGARYTRRIDNVCCLRRAFSQTDSALFVYTPRPQQPGVSPAAVSEVFQKHEGSGEWCPECSGTMPQVDFAPTIAALLGVPIPFGRYGAHPLV